MRRDISFRRWFGLAALTVGCGSSLAFGQGAAAGAKVDFAHDVVPILKKHCVECHGGGHSKGDFSLNTRESLLAAKAATPGKSGESPLAQRVVSTDPDEQMPPKDRPRLAAKEVAVLQAWIDQGLRWEQGFSFASQAYEPPLKPRRPELPPAKPGRENPIDRLLDRYLAAKKLPTPATVDDATFLRRAYLDLVGLLPTVAEQEEFLADARPDKRARWVERILADPQAYADHWLSFWNDLLRNDFAGTGYIDGGRKDLTAWLYRSLVENKPYDQFVRELIAPAPEAAGFIAGIKWRGNVNASQVREVQFAQNVAQVFLGINMKCASCHNSFIDRWTLDEAYGLAAIYATTPLEIHRCDKPTGMIAKPSWIFPELGQIDAQAPQPERLKQLAGLLTHANNGRLTRTIVNRLWAKLLGRGIVHPVDAMHTPPWNADLLDFLASDLAERKYDLKQTLALIAASQAYQAETAAAAQEAGPEYEHRGPLARRLSAEQFVDAVWSLTGSAPGKAQAPVAIPPAPAQPVGPRFVRAALMRNDPLMRALGRPNREQVVTSRPDVLTTLEALELENGQAFAGMLRRGAAQRLAAKPQSPDPLIEDLYRAALCRRPTIDEQAVAREIVGAPPTAQGVEDLLWSVLLLPEFLLVR